MVENKYGATNVQTFEEEYRKWVGKNITGHTIVPTIEENFGENMDYFCKQNLQDVENLDWILDTLFSPNKNLYDDLVANGKRDEFFYVVKNYNNNYQENGKNGIAVLGNYIINCKTKKISKMDKSGIYDDKDLLAGCGKIKDIFIHSIKDTDIHGKPVTNLMVNVANRVSDNGNDIQLTANNKGIDNDWHITSYRNQFCEVLPDGAFNNVNIDAINLPNLTRIGNSCFNGVTCNKLSLPKLYRIGANSFNGSKLGEELKLPYVCEMGQNCFNAVKGLNKISLSSRHMLEMANSFNNCDSLEEAHVGVEGAIWGSFNNCNDLELVNLPNLHLLDKKSCFRGCDYLRTVHADKLETKINTSVKNTSYSEKGTPKDVDGR